MSYINEEELAQRINEIRREKIASENRRRYFILKMKGQQVLSCQPCNIEIVSSSSATLIDWRSANGIEAECVINTVCEYFNTEPRLLIKRTRKREIVVVRQIAMYMLKKKTRLSLKSIGQMFGGRDHTTVIHSCQTVNNLIDTDEIYARNIAHLSNTIN